MIGQTERPTIPEPPTEMREPLAVRPRRGRRITIGIAVAIMVLITAAALARQTAPSSAPSVLTGATATASKLTARGQVRPIAQARVGTQTGGVVNRLIVQAGDFVAEEQEIARVRGPAGTEIVTAPFQGTITSVLARFGDTLPPGAPIATVGDLTRLQVETSDVDEYLIPYIYRGQSVTLLVDALDQELAGLVRTVALEPAISSVGDEHYPVAIDLLETSPRLRPGMSARIRFAG